MNKRDLESILAHLSHAASVMFPGRTFVHELFNLLHQVRAPNHRVHLTARARADLAWWNCFYKAGMVPPFSFGQSHPFMCSEMPQVALVQGPFLTGLGGFKSSGWMSGQR